jgi:hypothetical protein
MEAVRQTVAGRAYFIYGEGLDRLRILSMHAPAKNQCSRHEYLLAKPIQTLSGRFGFLSERRCQMNIAYWLELSLCVTKWLIKPIRAANSSDDTLKSFEMEWEDHPTLFPVLSGSSTTCDAEFLIEGISHQPNPNTHWNPTLHEIFSRRTNRPFSY